VWGGCREGVRRVLGGCEESGGRDGDRENTALTRAAARSHLLAPQIPDRHVVVFPDLTG